MLRAKPGSRPKAKIEIVKRQGAAASPVVVGQKAASTASAESPPAPSVLEMIEAVRLQLDPTVAEPQGSTHVSPEVVAEFRDVLFESVYLETHADVAAAVADGSFASGYAHWEQCGREEIARNGRDMGGVPSARTVRDRTAAVTLQPDTRAMVGRVNDWRVLMYAFARGETYIPAVEPAVVEDRAWQSPVTTSVATRSILSVTTPGLEHYYNVTPQVVAFYLPQYHRVRENDEWWGEGFTEWTNVRKAKPNFEGHFQPRVPLGQDYYDLAQPGVQKRQAGLAKEYGIRAFCYYLYWFDGRRLLERPLDQMLEDKTIDHEFCVCWANENWTRTWDGKAGDILLGQVHSAESDRRFILDAMKYLRDSRYMRIEGKLALLVYRVDLLPDASATAEIWREEVRQAGLGELHLCAVQFYGVTDPAPWGFDAAVEFPPHGWLGAENLMDPQPRLTNPEFKGYIYDYDKCVDWALAKSIPDYRWYRGAFPGWDNTARRQHTPHIFARSNAFSFERWVTAILRQTALMAPPSHQIVFLNAWNEWGEGAHLEPDEAGGYLNLMALNSALRATTDSSWLLTVMGRLRMQGDYPGRTADELSLINHVRGQEQALRALSEQLRGTGANPYL